MDYYFSNAAFLYLCLVYIVLCISQLSRFAVRISMYICLSNGICITILYKFSEKLTYTMEV